MNDILKQLNAIAQTKDEKTKQQLLAIKEQLASVLNEDQGIQELPGIAPDDISVGRKDIQQSQELLPEVKSLVLIVKKILINQSNGNYLSVKQKDIVAKRKESNSGTFEYTRLDAMERIYRNNGWTVTYESPDRDESFDAYFTFKAKK